MPSGNFELTSIKISSHCSTWKRRSKLAIDWNWVIKDGVENSLLLETFFFAEVCFFLAPLLLFTVYENRWCSVCAVTGSRHWSRAPVTSHGVFWRLDNSALSTTQATHYEYLPLSILVNDQVSCYVKQSCISLFWSKLVCVFCFCVAFR